MTRPAALVWFKRDLRVRDHAPLDAPLPAGGERAAWATLERFLGGRGRAGWPGPTVPVELPALHHDEVTMNLFNKLPGFVRSPPGLEQRIWRRLPAIGLWGTLLPLMLAGVNRALAPAAPAPGASDSAMLLWDYTMFGVVVLHWTLVLTVALACFIVRVMKGPAYVADAYPLPVDNGAPMTRP